MQSVTNSPALDPRTNSAPRSGQTANRSGDPVADAARGHYAPRSRVLNAADKRTRQMARTMRALGDNCTDVLLHAEGYSWHEQRTLGQAARALANRQSEIDVALDPDAPAEKSDDDLLAEIRHEIGGILDVGQIIAGIRQRFPDLRHDRLARLWPQIKPDLAGAILKAALPVAN